MELIKTSTHSLCPRCLEIVTAQIGIEGDSVVMEKTCPRHGYFKIIIERDIYLYRELNHSGLEGIKPAEGERSLIIPVEYRCNLNCLFCFLPNRQKSSLSLSQLREIVSGYKGSCIELSGGEPTLREDIFEIIKMVKAGSKSCRIVTNGIRLKDKDFLRGLKDAGIDEIVLSLYSNDAQMEADICGKSGVLEEKNSALKNLEELNIPFSLCMTVIPSKNEVAIKDFVLLAMRLYPRIKFIGLRTVARVGRYPIEEKYFLSDFLKTIGQALGINYRQLLNERAEHFSPYFIYVPLYFVKLGSRIIVLKPSLDMRLSRMKIWLKLGREAGIPNTVLILLRRIFLKDKPVKKMLMRIASWPDRFDVDLNETALGKFEHLYGGRENVNLLEAMIFNEGL